VVDANQRPYVACLAGGPGRSPGVTGPRRSLPRAASTKVCAAPAATIAPWTIPRPRRGPCRCGTPATGPTLRRALMTGSPAPTAAAMPHLDMGLLDRHRRRPALCQNLLIDR